jgi:flavin reductase ActVB
MAAFPSGVTIVTTTDAGDGGGASRDVLPGVDGPADPARLPGPHRRVPPGLRAGPVLDRAGGRPPPRRSRPLVRHPRGGKVADADFTADERGLPVLEGACVTLDCSAHVRHAGGDHTILLGRVDRTQLGEDTPAVYFRRGFHELTGR